MATGKYTANAEAIEHAYLVGSTVVREPAQCGQRYQRTVPWVSPEAA
jgi:hypothetical protein